MLKESVDSCRVTPDTVFVMTTSILRTEIADSGVRRIHGGARVYSVIPWGGTYALRVEGVGGDPIALGDWATLIATADDIESAFIVEGLANGTLVQDMWLAGRYEEVK